jgi:WD40 repeat protein
VLKTGAVAVIDLRDQLPVVMQVPLNDARAVAISPRDETIALGFADGTVNLRASPEPSLGARTIVTGGSALRCLAFAPDGARLAAGDADGGVYLLKLDGWLAHAHLLGRYHERTNALAFSPDGEILLSGHQDGALVEWAPARAIGPVRRIDAHERAINGLLVVDSGLAAEVTATASDDGTVRIWEIGRDDISTSSAVHVHRGAVHSIAEVRAPLPLALSAGEDGTVRAWSPVDGTVIGTWLEHAPAVTAMTVGWDGLVLLTGHADGTARLWRTPKEAGGSAAMLGEIGAGGPITAVALDPRTRCAVLAGVDAALYLWHVDRPHDLPWTLTSGHGAAIACMAIVEDTGQAMTGSGDGHVRLTDLRSGDTQALAGDWGHVAGIALTGRRAASCDANGVVAIWDLSHVSQPRLLRTVRIDAAASGMAMTRDARRIAIITADGGVWIGDPDGGPYTVHFQADAGLRSCAFVERPRRLIVGDAAGRVHVLRPRGDSA